MARVAAVSTDSLEALKAFLEGEQALRAPRDLERARSALQRAVEIDSTFALAWSRLAYVVGWNWSTDPAFDYLDAPVRRVTQSDTPFPFSPSLLAEAAPNVRMIKEALKEVMYL